MGDEHCDVYYRCPNCGWYTIAQCWDNFTGGDETCTLTGPIPKEEGDARVVLITRCKTPWDKKCRCDAHRDYFNEALD